MKSAMRTVAGERVDGARENRAAGRLIDPAQLLHRLRGQRDLVAGELAPAGLAEQPVHLVLDVVGLAERRGRQRAAQPLEPPPLLVPLENVPRDPRDLRLVGHPLRQSLSANMIRNSVEVEAHSWHDRGRDKEIAPCGNRNRRPPTSCTPRPIRLDGAGGGAHGLALGESWVAEAGEQVGKVSAQARDRPEIGPIVGSAR